MNSIKWSIMKSCEGIYYNFYGDILEGNYFALDGGLPPTITKFNCYIIDEKTGKRKENITYGLSQTLLSDFIPLPESKQISLRKKRIALEEAVRNPKNTSSITSNPETFEPIMVPQSEIR